MRSIRDKFKIRDFLFILDEAHWKLKHLTKVVRYQFRNVDENVAVNSSDSENTSYVNAVKKFNKSSKKNRRFRNEINYKFILEHVKPSQGEKYLEEILSMLDKREISLISEIIRQNDSYGKPRCSYYRFLGKSSPTTLRYLKIALEIKKLFGNIPNMTVSELGIGYGGQASIISKIMNIKKYYAYDIPEVCILAKKYLEEINNPMPIVFTEITNPITQYPDLFLSNYAFSELPENLQRRYLEKLICYSPRGYMIMNSGLTNATNRSYGKMRFEEIKEYLPNARIIDETPKTGIDNYVIIWGN